MLFEIVTKSPLGTTIWFKIVLFVIVTELRARKVSEIKLFDATTEPDTSKFAETLLFVTTA